MAGRGKSFQLLDFPKFAMPTVTNMDAALTSLNLIDRLGGKSFMSYAPIFARLGDFVSGAGSESYIASHLSPYSEPWKNESIQEAGRLLANYFGSRGGRWYPHSSKPIRVLGFWFKPSIKGIWFVDGRAYAVLINARKSQRLTTADMRFLARGVHELHCIDDPNDPTPLIIDVSERNIGLGRKLTAHVMSASDAITLDEFDAALREFLRALALAGVAVPAATDADSIVSLFKKK